MILLLATMALASSPLERVEGLLAKGKAKQAAALAERSLAKAEDATEASELEAALARARWALVTATPTLTEVQLWRLRFGDSALARDALELEATLAHTEATRLGTEAGMLGVALQYAGTEAATAARGDAGDLVWSALKAGGTADSLLRFELRYPESPHASEAAALGAQRAYAEAVASPDVAVLARFVEACPDHERIVEARETLRSRTWAVIEAGQGTPDVLWRFAGDHPDTPEGWTAAQRAFEIGLVAHAGTLALEPEPSLGEVLRRIDVDLGFSPPPSFVLELDAEVDVGGWAPWGEAAAAMAPALAASGPGAGENRTTRKGRSMSWTPALPICSPDGDLRARMVARLRRGERVTERTLPFTITARCAGTRELVFSRLGDDLDGPTVALARTGGSWSLQPVDLALPATWSCSHVTALDEAAAEVECGPLSARLGWHGGFWFRATDRAARSSSRVELVTPGDQRPLRLKEKPRRVVDAQGSTVTLLSSGQEPVIAVPPLAVAFGSTPDGPRPAPAMTESVPAVDGVPLPVGVPGVVLKRADPTPELAAAVKTLGGTSRIVWSASPTTTTSLAVLDASPWGHAVLIATGGWSQVMPLSSPTTPEWVAFEVDGAAYYRTVGVSPAAGMRLRTHTLRWNGERWVVDVGDVP